MEQTRPQVAVGKGTTMKYLCLLACEPDSGPAPGSAEFGQMLAEFGEATSAMAAAGVAGGVRRQWRVNTGPAMYATVINRTTL
jgi:hypothetical protein